ncbi:hypothetical protein BU23DRAFT_652459 [Bimuria novae-zelandiae CBS 107.79]|uniref:Amidohydrolase n=1 Tax=Bimuria novae-zelandiae CBS 107.79 TaxID=1447943 RepID=A0A6A5V0Y4_9PLEO|nr:hypothetical protein BU23DRAFT_652459 [Bimuria novae-zelandiae CBS 107.79]
MRSPTGILLSASALLSASCIKAQDISEEVFAAIDKQDDGLRTVNKEHCFSCGVLQREGPAVSFNSKFDALPGIGHSCGHNLIATIGIAAAIGVKEALENQGVSGKVVLMGTPAEESLGGKIKLLEAGAYDGPDCSLMAHPGNNAYASYGRTLASWRANVTWSGEAAHAAAAPYMGRNALDGFVSAYSSTGLYRQQLMGTDPETANFTITAPEDDDGVAAASSDQGNVLQNETFAEQMWDEWEAMIAEISVGLGQGSGNSSGSERRRSVAHVH